MTGKDLIIYIMSHKLEDEPIYKDGSLVGFDTEDKFAEKMNVGVSTVRAWIDLGMVNSIRIGNVNYIPIIHAFKF